MVQSFYSVGVAFMRGDPRVFGDLVVMRATRGPFVHSEFFIQKDADIRFYTAANLVHDTNPLVAGGFMPSRRLRALPTNGAWETVRFPVSKECYLSTYAWILQILAMKLPYNSRDLWQCCVQVFPTWLEPDRQLASINNIGICVSLGSRMPASIEKFIEASCLHFT
jgi:hypothetical protein